MLGCLAGAGFPGERSVVFALDGDRHADVGEMLFQRDDVLVEQTDAALTGATGNGALVVGAAVDADALEAGRGQPQEPVSVGPDVAAAVMKVVFPGRCILYHGDLERLASGRLGCAMVTSALLVALVFTHAAGELRHHHGVASGIAVIHGELQVTLADDDKGCARGAGGKWLLQEGGSVAVGGIVGGC